MGRKKVDLKIRVLIERCIRSHQRSFFVILGEKAREQIVILNHIFLKIRSELELCKPNVLWCFKKDNGFSYICKKSQKSLKKKYSGNYSLCEEDCLEHFFASTNIQFCHYNDTTSVLGQTFSMLVIQDFEALTPNILARITETVEGGGLIIMIISSIQAVQDISSIKMDIHSRFITSAYSDIDPVFNSRLVQSLADCKTCLILDDSMKILYYADNLETLDDDSQTLVTKKRNFAGQRDSVDVLDRIASLCCTTDQRNAIKTFISVLKEKSTKSVISLTSSRGRGKSAGLGLAVSCALYLRYSIVYVTSPHIENLQTLFQFIISGLKMLNYKEEKDYSITYSKAENVRLISGITVYQDHRQVVKYVSPTEFCNVGMSDLVVIDEAAAIPLPLVKNWLKSDIVFMASTINGYEGTGRSLSLKLINQLRSESQKNFTKEESMSPKKTFVLHEVTLNEAIRYAEGDSVELWLNKLFCLDTEIMDLRRNAPPPQLCQLYYINKKLLFSYQKIAEIFLQQLTALFVSSHYKNSPNDLLMMADAPSHHLFCLVPPVDKSVQCLPDVLCVIQVAFEGQISKDSVIQELSYGKRASGDLVPWIISQQFQDNNFPQLSSARVVRIATHPNYQRMGYGQHALQLLLSYYERNSKENLPSTNLKNANSALLLKLDELESKTLDYVGVSYGLTLELLKFWKKNAFVPVYIRQTTSETTGEHSCVMVKNLNPEKSTLISEYLNDFVVRFLTLLPSAFKNLSAALALEILHCRKNIHLEVKDFLTDMNMQSVLSSCGIKRLEAYCNHLVDYHLIMDLIPVLARCYFLNYFKDDFLSSVQEAILVSMGLQNKSVEEVSEELKMQTNQTMGLFLKLVKKLLQHVHDLQKNCIQNKNFQFQEEKWKYKSQKRQKTT